MFKRLRNRFLVLNLVTISVMMLFAFAAIYMITYQDVQRDIRMELQKVADFNNKPGGMGGTHLPKGDHPPQGPDAGDGRGFGPERSVTFTILTDEAWKRTGVNSIYTMEDSFYDLALQTVSKEQSETGQVSLDSNEWAYTVRETADGHRVTFVDVTARQGILTNLIYTFLAVGLVMLIVIFFISRYFANRSIAPVQEAFDKQKRFIADASHELKTPLAIINTNADVLLANGDDTIRNQAKWLSYIKSETERMSKLTGDLLYLTEMDDAREGMIFTTLNVSDAVENVVLMMEAAIFEKQILLDYEIEPDVLVRGNGEQMKQVVMILLDNAMKYTNAKGSIRLELKKHHHEMVLAVTNTGEGIAAEHLDRIFDRFYRTDTSRARKHGGYGLGLAIAKAIVEQHKGKIFAKSALKENATFYVQIPLERK